MEKRTFVLALFAAALGRSLVAAEPPLRSVGFLVLPGVYNSELMAPYDVLDHVRFRTRDAPKVFTVAKDAAMYLVERLYGADARAKIGEGLVLDWSLPAVKHRIAPGARLP